MGVGMRAIDEDLDVALARQLHDLVHRKDLAGEVGDVRDFDHLGLRRDRVAEHVDEVFLRRRRHLEARPA